MDFQSQQSSLKKRKRKMMLSKVNAFLVWVLFLRPIQVNTLKMKEDRWIILSMISLLSIFQNTSVTS
jgi:hypothetical protein